MPSVDRWQTSYVRYKTQPEAYVCQAGWELATSRKFAEKLAQEESAFTEDTLLYNGLAPCKVSLRIVDAPAEYAVPVKQDRCAAHALPHARMGAARRCAAFWGAAGTQAWCGGALGGGPGPPPAGSMPAGTRGSAARLCGGRPCARTRPAPLFAAPRRRRAGIP
jgi:hypothetical protein